MKRLDASPWQRARYRCLDAREFLTGTFPPSESLLSRLLYGREVNVEFPLLLCSDQEGRRVTLGDITGKFPAELHGRLAERNIVGEYLYLPACLHIPGQRTILARYDLHAPIPLGITARTQFAQ